VTRDERLEAAARLLEEAVGELERAARHCATAAAHFRGGEIPHGAAHAWAARGHLLEAGGRLDEQARVHAKHSNP
jgi:hypothetical protein